MALPVAGARKDVLIIVMGTSGSGKSTLGAALAEALHVPFIDGDDLHPAANVDKMSRGHPLDDADRLPWLLAIREEATRICSGGHTASTKEQEQSSAPLVRDLAEELETSHRHAGAGESILDEASRAKQREAEAASASGSRAAVDSVRPSSRRKACVIACSALKKSYRHLLRYGLQGVDAAGNINEVKDAHRPSSTSLDVYHVYVTVSSQELLHRMHERKGHFMKESMLQSQLATLEEPDAQREPRMLIMADGSIESLVKQAETYFDRVL